MKAMIGSAAAMALLAACTTGAHPSGETSISYVSGNGIAEWKVAGDDTLYIKSIGGDWYHVRTMNECPRLRTANSLGFVTSGLDQLDRFGAIIAEGVRCPLESVTRSGPPPEEEAS